MTETPNAQAGVGTTQQSNEGTTTHRTSTAGSVKEEARQTPVETETSSTNVNQTQSGDTGANNGTDPLSMHILQRTRTEHRIRRNEDDGALQRGKESGEHQSSLPKEKKSSFFKRLIHPKPKPEEDDAESFDHDLRDEGADADVFSRPIGFIPQYPQPPKYIRVRSHNVSKKQFDRVFLAQELTEGGPCESEGHPVYEKRAGPEHGSVSSVSSSATKNGAIWVMKFSRDGKYLAVGGQDTIVRVWRVICNDQDRKAHESQEDAQDGKTRGESKRVHAPVFCSQPLQGYRGHTADVLDLSWSKNNFLLSSSMDKTVRLWHISRKECLCVFQHSDFVTSIIFHPRDDRFFLSGSLDSKLRLWSIPDKVVAYWNELSDLITAVAFSPDGRTAIAGTFTGLCLFYETEGLRYHTQMTVKSPRSRKSSKGSKITGIETIAVPADDPAAIVKVLVSSNDSRIRMYNFRDKTLENKFKGHENTCSQIHATFSDDARYVISGSEDKKVYIWSSCIMGEKKGSEPYEYFHAHSAIVTATVIAPAKTRQLLADSGDPIYDICSPPPVRLRSTSQAYTSPDLDKTPKASRNVTPRAFTTSALQQTPSARSLHRDGNIVVTADHAGHIKVFRQDCGWTNREAWDNQSLQAGMRGLLNGSTRGSFGAGSDVHRSLRNSFLSMSREGSIASFNNDESERGRRSRSPIRKLGESLMRTSRNSSVAIVSRSPSRTRAETSEHDDQKTALNKMWVQPNGVSFKYYDDNPDDTLDVHRHRKDSDASALLSANEFRSSDESAGEEDLRCEKCGGMNFKARKLPSGPQKGITKLQCTNCKTMLE